MVKTLLQSCSALGVSISLHCHTTFPPLLLNDLEIMLKPLMIVVKVGFWYNMAVWKSHWIDSTPCCKTTFHLHWRSGLQLKLELFFFISWLLLKHLRHRSGFVVIDFILTKDEHIVTFLLSRYNTYVDGVFGIPATIKNWIPKHEKV